MINYLLENTYTLVFYCTAHCILSTTIRRRHDVMFVVWKCLYIFCMRLCLPTMYVIRNKMENIFILEGRKKTSGQELKEIFHNNQYFVVYIFSVFTAKWMYILNILIILLYLLPSPSNNVPFIPYFLLSLPRRL